MVLAGQLGGRRALREGLFNYSALGSFPVESSPSPTTMVIIGFGIQRI